MIIAPKTIPVRATPGVARIFSTTKAGKIIVATRPRVRANFLT